MTNATPTPQLIGYGTAIHSPDTLKSIRETLCVAQSAVNNSPSARPGDSDRIQRLIDDIDRQRPTGPDGTHGNRHTATCGCRAIYRREARAALAAMPKPIGYVGASHEEGVGWTLDIEYGEYLRPTAAQALKDCSDYHCPIAAVVAVVPVEGNPA